MVKREINRGSLKKFVSGFIIGGLLFGIVGWYLQDRLYPPSNYRGVVLRQSNLPYQYIGPLLSCDIGSQDTFPELFPLKSKLTDTVNKDIANGNAENISIYFRGLNSSHWFDINGDTTYIPASLFKVFIMMAYYNEADDTSDPGLLQRRILFTGTTTPITDIAGNAIPKLTNGGTYTIEELINQMITYSDNDAATVLTADLVKNYLNGFNSIFSDFQIPSPATQKEGEQYLMSVDNYAMVFRTLFSATYLGRDYSENALNMLSKTSYTSGIVAGVPRSVTVAHKYGDAEEGSSRELHDCGIVYYPKHPYLLCVMTKGNDFTSLQNVIQDISTETYQFIDSLHPTPTK